MSDVFVDVRIESLVNGWLVSIETEVTRRRYVFSSLDLALDGVKALFSKGEVE